MWSLFVVADLPGPCDFSNLAQCSEQVRIKYFMAERSIEALDVSVLIGFARLDVNDVYVVRNRPVIPSSSGAPSRYL